MFTYSTSPYIFTDHCGDVNTATVTLKVFDNNMTEVSFPDPGDPFSVNLNAGGAMAVGGTKWKDMDVDGAGFTTTASFNDRWTYRNVT